MPSGIYLELECGRVKGLYQYLAAILRGLMPLGIYSRSMG